ncbi:MAG: hypothetical protein ACLFPH_03125 [Bacteroidales bacterium]
MQYKRQPIPEKLYVFNKTHEIARWYILKNHSPLAVKASLAGMPEALGE